MGGPGWWGVTRPGLGHPDDRIAGAKYVWGKRVRPSQPESVMTMIDDDDDEGRSRGMKKAKGGKIESGMYRCATHLGIGFVCGRVA